MAFSVGRKNIFIVFTSKYVLSEPLNYQLHPFLQVRTTLLERRTLLDHEDKAVLRRALDKVADSVPVRGTASMPERLEAIARCCTESLVLNQSNVKPSDMFVLQEYWWQNEIPHGQPVLWVLLSEYRDVLCGNRGF